MFDGLAIHFHAGLEQRRTLVLRTKLRVVGVHQNGVAQVVVRTAGATHASCIDAHLGVCLLGKRHLHTLHSFVVTDDRSPVVAHFGWFGWTFHEPTVVPCRATIHVFVVCPWQSLYVLRASRHEFNTCRHAVVHVGEEVVALVPSHLADVHSQSQCHGSMSAVASRFLHLSQLPVGTRFERRLAGGDH